MDRNQTFAVSALLESMSREDFAIHLYNRQHHRDPFATVPFTPLYYVLNEVYPLSPSPAILSDLLGIVEVEIVHKRRFSEAVKELNPKNEPAPKVVFPEDLFGSITVPEVEPIPGMKTTLRVIVTDLVQEQRARLIYEYLSEETSGPVSDLFAEIAQQEIAHHRIFERALSDVRSGKKINMYCPVCGKILPQEPKEGYQSGCGFCMSKLILKIDEGDFALHVR
jgi:rubrerythrin